MTIDFKEALFVFEEEEHKKTKFMCARRVRPSVSTFESLNPTPPNFLNFLFLWSNARIFKQKVKKTFIRIVERDVSSRT
jgi:hypothetical protein